MNRIKNIGLILCGLVLGLALSAPAARAVESLKATLSTNRILVDGKEVRLTAYNINGNNYVMLRDVGKTVGFEVYWDGDAKCGNLIFSPFCRIGSVRLLPVACDMVKLLG